MVVWIDGKIVKNDEEQRMLLEANLSARRLLFVVTAAAILTKAVPLVKTLAPTTFPVLRNF